MLQIHVRLSILILILILKLLVLLDRPICPSSNWDKYFGSNRAMLDLRACDTYEITKFIDFKFLHVCLHTTKKFCFETFGSDREGKKGHR